MYFDAFTKISMKKSYPDLVDLSSSDLDKEVTITKFGTPSSTCNGAKGMVKVLAELNKCNGMLNNFVGKCEFGSSDNQVKIADCPYNLDSHNWKCRVPIGFAWKCCSFVCISTES